MIKTVWKSKHFNKILYAMIAACMIAIYGVSINAAYAMGRMQEREESPAYSEEYLHTYATEVWAHMYVFPDATFDESFDRAQLWCDMLYRE